MSQEISINFKNRIIFPDSTPYTDSVVENSLLAFSMLPVDVIDLSTRSRYLDIAKSAIRKAEILYNEHFNENLNAPLLQLSIFTSDFLEDKNIFKKFQQEKLDFFELHVDIDDNELIAEALQEMIQHQSIETFYTVNLNRKYHSNSQLKILINQFNEILPKGSLNLCINGNEDNFNSNGVNYFDSIQALATCDIIIKDLKVRERKKFKNLKIYLTDEVNLKTTALAKLCELSIDGFSFGSHSSISFYELIFKNILESTPSKENSYSNYENIMKVCIENFMDYNFNFYK